MSRVRKTDEEYLQIARDAMERNPKRTKSSLMRPIGIPPHLVDKWIADGTIKLVPKSKKEIERARSNFHHAIF